jgi:hypothetical protein
MRNYSRVLLLAVSLVAMAGCGFLGGDREDAALPNDPTAFALLKTALDNREPFETGHLSFYQSISSPDGTLDYVVETDLTAYGRGYSTIKSSIGEFEMVFDEVTAYIRRAGGTWEPRNRTGAVPEAGVSADGLQESFDYSSFVRSVAFESRGHGSETTLRATIDVEAFFEKMLRDMDESSSLAKALVSATEMSGRVLYRLDSANGIVGMELDVSYLCQGRRFEITSGFTISELKEPISLPSDLPIKL